MSVTLKLWHIGVLLAVVLAVVGGVVIVSGRGDEGGGGGGPSIGILQPSGAAVSQSGNTFDLGPGGPGGSRGLGPDGQDGGLGEDGLRTEIFETDPGTF
ncbi:MAG TPA: hypothetical protein VFS30_03175 [Dehalococcoidia bacterium]|nr:hypothetical protein [Dehalococcoidia bacterium]